MSFFVYLTDKCRASAQQYGVEEALENLQLSIESEQSLWRLKAFEFPFWVKKGLGGRHLRLVCRLESHQIEDQSHEVLVFLALYQRQSREYQQVYENIRQAGTALYQRLIQPDEVATWLTEQLTHDPAPAMARPSQPENAFLYGSNVDRLPNPENQPLLYETWEWFEQGLLQCQPEKLQELAQALHQHYQGRLAARTVLRTLGSQQVVLYHVDRHQASVLTAEPVDAAGSIQNRDLLALLAQADELDTRQFHQQLARMARRCYDWEKVHPATAWARLARSMAAHLSFSPEEQKILSIARDDTTRPFPLFINGRAGSGKSTILQYLFAEYWQLALEQDANAEQPVFPVYLTCNAILSERAAELIAQVCQTQCVTSFDRKLLADHCLEFRSYLLKRIPQEQQVGFSRELYVDYGRFRQLWQERFRNNPAMLHTCPPSLCWHVIRSYIKGMHHDQWLEPEDYCELGREERLLAEDVYRDIYRRVWANWYLPLCNENGYWDDQDLARHVLTRDLVKPEFAAVFGDEAQDFTRVEFDILLRLNLFAARQVEPKQIQRIPIVFAGDQFQTLNPTGFRWESIKAQVVEQFVFALDPARKAGLSDLNYLELSFNFRSSPPITHFSNVVHGLRARLFGLKKMQPQQCWRSQSEPRPVVYVDAGDAAMAQQLSGQFDLMFVLPCLDGQETQYIRENPALQTYLQLREDGSTTIPAMSVIRAKGLEFARVALYGFAGDCPDDLDLSTPADSPEQSIGHEYFLNRLYVGITRARSQLLLIDDAAGYKRLWQPLEQAWQPPVNLQALPNAQTDWQPWLGTLRKARLTDVEPDSEQLLSMQENAQNLEQQGLENRDAYLLRQAAGLHGQLGNTRQQQHCLAEALFLERDYGEAGRLFASLQRLEQAFEAYWRQGSWVEIRQLLHNVALPNSLRNGLIADFLRLDVNVDEPLQVQQFPALLKLLQQLEQEVREERRSVEPDHKASWYQLLNQFLGQLPIHQPSPHWPALHGVLRQLTLTPYFKGHLSVLQLAEQAYLVKDWKQASQYWEQAQKEAKVTPPFPRYQEAKVEGACLSKDWEQACHYWEVIRDQNGTPPPFPRYEEAVVAARSFPRTLEALHRLKRPKQLVAQFQDYASKATTVSSKHWKQLLDTLSDLTSPEQFREMLNQIISQKRNSGLIEQLIEHASPIEAHASWIGSLQKVHQLCIYLERHWSIIWQEMQQDPPKPFLSKENFHLLMYGLAVSEQHTQLSRGSGKKENPESKEQIRQILEKIKSIFRISMPIETKTQPSSQSEEIQRTVWRTNSSDVILLGAVLENHGTDTEALEFYEQLEARNPQRARELWIACKQWQIKAIEQEIKNPEQEGKNHTGPQQKENLSKPELLKKKYQAQLKNKITEWGFPQNKLTKIPDYVELMPVDEKIKEILCRANPIVLPPVTDFSATQGVKFPTETPKNQPKPQVEDLSPVTQIASALPSPRAEQQKQPEASETSSSLTAPDLPVSKLQTPETNPLASMLKATFLSHHYQTQAIANELPLSATVNNQEEVQLSPTTTMRLLDYRLLVVRSQGRINIEHQLTGHTLAIWPAKRRITGDWPILVTEGDQDLMQVEGTPLWVKWQQNPHCCTIRIPAQGVQIEIDCSEVHPA